MNNETTRPHIAILNVQLEISSTTDRGECSGKIINEEALNKLGVKSRFLLSASGFDLEDCVKNLKTKLTRWQDE